MNTSHRFPRSLPLRRLPLRLPFRVLLPGLMLALVAGCSILGGGNKENATIYAPDPRVAADPSWPSVPWQLTVARPTSARMIDSLRIAVRPTPGELQVYKGASWAKTPTEMVEDGVLRALEDSGKIPAVARSGSGIAADYRLLADLRRFEADYDGQALPSATIEVSMKLMHAQDQQVVASRTFLHAQPSTGVDVPQVSAAFEQALGALSRDVAGWALTTGDLHERSGVHQGDKRR